MSSNIKIASVILDHYHEKMDHYFDYLVPETYQKSIMPGMRVLVPFGKGNKTLEAYIMKVWDSREAPENLKFIYSLIESKTVMSSHHLKLVHWMKKHYLCRYIEGIRCFVPSGLVLKSNREVYYENGIRMVREKTSSKNTPKKVLYASIATSMPPWDELKTMMKRAPVQLKVMEILREKKTLPLVELIQLAGTARQTVKSLETKKLVLIEEKIVSRNPFRNRPIIPYPAPVLTEDQLRVWKGIKESLTQHPQKPVLLHGITGSGKTEIYLHLIEENLKKGKDSIIMVPEISLTPQMIDRFRGRCGETVAVLHSHLTQGERLDEWRKIKDGKVKIVIGPRSAIFAPFRNLGMIVIDEVHESSYKSEQSPRYHALEVARARSIFEKANLLMGSATPSVESYYQSLQEEFHLETLEERIPGAKLPDIETVDMRQEFKAGNTTLFSQKLICRIKERLERGEQSILFLNRRGYSTLVNCFHCGNTMKCDYCDIPMKWHRRDNRLKCHFCGWEQKTITQCPECQQELVYKGFGTQKIEETLKEYFPDASIMRMDMDTTRQKGSHEQLLQEFGKGKHDILLGTQMITKGLDFPNVTLVGVLMADASLGLPDFRASEKTFQLITQVAGRAGRGEISGNVVLQTYQPDHYAVSLAARQEYLAFYQKEIQLRKNFRYPPFSDMILITFSGKEEENVKFSAEASYKSFIYLLEERGNESIENTIMAPVVAPLTRAEGKYRYHLLLKSGDTSINILKKMIKYILIENKEKLIDSSVTTVIDINPYILL
ncbi:replication restart DNA helicase PriA [Tindallia magadiensis]|uniref:Replication restart protein PriA n=1 Tax=Tindallia magadiensis TaxID=69895 RepID=A0A1I3AME3_9FIRM|nr:primosomal protein N' [Tindallia magadiensis]SFH51268.1 replication restart DNA helicase PriA [Tindallia magadiensis]